MIRGGAAENAGASPINKFAKDAGAAYSSLRQRWCGPDDAQSAVEIEKAKRQLLAELRNMINRGTGKERADAITEIAELAKKGELRPFIELATPVSFCINEKMADEEKKAVLDLVSTLSAVPEEQLKRSGFEEGVECSLLRIAMKFQDFLFRNDFFKGTKTGLFESAARALIKTSPERALAILLNQLGALNYECRHLLSSRAYADGLEGPEMRSMAELLDAAARYAGSAGDVSPLFAEAVKGEGEAFKADVMRRSETAKEVARENPMVRIVQLASMAKLIGEAQAVLGKMDILEAREIHEALANARALMKQLNA